MMPGIVSGLSFFFLMAVSRDTKGPIGHSSGSSTRCLQVVSESIVVSSVGLVTNKVTVSVYVDTKI